MLERYNLIMTGYINLPPFSEATVEKLLEWHDSVKETLANPGAVALRQPWIASVIRDYDSNLESPIKLNSGISGNPWNFDFVDKFPELISVFNSLPFDNIERIYLLENYKFCDSHNDQSKFLYSENSIEPCNYRMTLRNSQTSKGFFVQPKPFKTWGTADAIKKQGFPVYYWPGKPGYWWVLNNYCCQHGSDWKLGDNKVILSIQGTPNEEKHLALLKDSDHLKSITHPNLAEYDSSNKEEKRQKMEHLKNISLKQTVPKKLMNRQ